MNLDEVIARAQLEYRSGDIAGASATLRLHLEFNPGDGAARVELSRVLLMQGDAAGAEQQARQASDDARVAPWAQAAVARIIGLDPNRAAEALEWAERAVQTQQDNGDLLLVYAARLADVGRVPEAVAVFERAIALSPSDPLLRARAHTSAAVALVGTDEGRATAQRHATTALQLDPSNALAAQVMQTLELLPPPGLSGKRAVMHTGRARLAEGDLHAPAARFAVRGALARALAVSIPLTLLGGILYAVLTSQGVGAQSALIAGSVVAPLLVICIAFVLLRSLGAPGVRRLLRALQGAAEWFAAAAVAVAVVNAVVVAVTGIVALLIAALAVLVVAEVTLIISTRSGRWQQSGN